MSKTNDLIRLGARLELKLAQQDKITPAVKKVMTDLVSYLRKIASHLSKDQNNYKRVSILEGMANGCEGWLSEGEVTLNGYYYVSNMWDQIKGGLDGEFPGASDWIDQQLYTVFQNLNQNQ